MDGTVGQLATGESITITIDTPRYTITLTGTLAPDSQDRTGFRVSDHLEIDPNWINDDLFAGGFLMAARPILRSVDVHLDVRLDVPPAAAGTAPSARSRRRCRMASRVRVWIARRLYLAGARVDPYRIATMAEAAAAIDKFIEDQRAVSDGE